MIGRTAELAELATGLSGAEGRVAALVLAGEPGIGKSTLWEAGVSLARQQGRRVLAARGSEAETGLSFGALIDLLDGVETAELAALPTPQRRALEVALLRADPTGEAPEPHAIPVALLSALRSLARGDRLLVAVDDIQWLDPASTDALAFAARRLDTEAITFLLARRPGPASALEQAFRAPARQHLDLRALDEDTTRDLLLQRLGLRLTRRELHRVFDATLGNPLWTLEVGRLLVERGAAIGDDLPVPDDVEDLLGRRVVHLRAPVRQILLALALDGDLRMSQLAAVAGRHAVDDAVQTGVLHVDGDRARPSHPLLAAAAKAQAPTFEQQDLHHQLATVVADPAMRALHQALATPYADEALASDLSAAAARVAARGAASQAVVLAAHALRLTLTAAEARSSRVLDLAGYLKVAGEDQQLTDLLHEELEALPGGRPRVRALLLLTAGPIEGNDTIRGYFERALDEAGADPRLRSRVLAGLAENEAAVRVARIPDAERWALEAMPGPGGAGREEELAALYALSWARSLRGQPIDHVCDRFRAAAPGGFYLVESPERVAAQRLVWRGEVESARGVLGELLARADERGEPSSYALQRLHLCELELRAGSWDAAATLLEGWAGTSESELLHWPMYERCQALLAAGRGQPEEARRWGDEASALAERRGVRWDWLEAQRALGVVDLLVRRPGPAADRLGAVWEHTQREGVDEPGTFPVAPDLVEALSALDDLEAARTVTLRLHELADRTNHPWASVSARRCDAVVRLAGADHDEQAAAQLAEAAADYGRLGLAFDRARTLLALGGAERRSRKWGAAREVLERAATAFDAIGSSGWAAAVRAELERVGARRPASAGRLTTTERRVAELAASGLANKQIATELVVTVNTVEFHLRNTYAKLGIRSRTQLAGRLSEMSG